MVLALSACDISESHTFRLKLVEANTTNSFGSLISGFTSCESEGTFHCFRLKRVTSQLQRNRAEFTLRVQTLFRATDRRLPIQSFATQTTGLCFPPHEPISVSTPRLHWRAALRPYTSVGPVNSRRAMQDDDDLAVVEGNRRRAAVLAHLAESQTASQVGEISKVAFESYAPALVLLKRANDDETRPFTICVDLDGTLAQKEEPFCAETIGEPIAKAVAWVHRFHEAGARIIIFTVRGNCASVAKWLNANGVPYDYINENPDQPKDASAKLLADVYWDDRAYNALDPDEHGPSIVSKIEAHSDSDETDSKDDERVAKGNGGMRIAVYKQTVITVAAPVLLDVLSCEA